MKFTLTICALVLFVAASCALPLEDVDDEYVLARSKRATCDLLSIDTKIGSLNHAACAAHCLVMGKGFKGGRCRDGVCHCRK